MNFQHHNDNSISVNQEFSNFENEIYSQKPYKSLISETDFQNFLFQLEVDIQRNLEYKETLLTSSISKGPSQLEQEFSFDFPSFTDSSSQSGNSAEFSLFDQGPISSTYQEVEHEPCFNEQNTSSEETGSPGNFDKNSFWDEKNKSKLLIWTKKFRHDWKKIAKLFGVKQITPSCVKNKYQEIKNNKAPLRVRFTHEEDLLIAKYHSLYGFDWKKIAQFIPSRTDMMVKNRFYAFIRKHNLLKDLLEEVRNRDFSN